MLKRLLPGLVIIVVAVLAIQAIDPFGGETKDRSQPALVQSIEDLGELRTARANLQVVVDLENDTILPRFLKGTRTLFIAAGDVDAAIDLGAAKVTTDGETATITVPPPKLTKPRVDLQRSRVYDRDRGVLDRIGDALGDRGTDNEAVYAAAEKKLAEAAAQDDVLATTARDNARDLLAGLARGLGFERVEVRFQEPAAPAS